MMGMGIAEQIEARITQPSGPVPVLLPPPSAPSTEPVALPVVQEEASVAEQIQDELVALEAAARAGKFPVRAAVMPGRAAVVGVAVKAGQAVARAVGGPTAMGPALPVGAAQTARSLGGLTAGLATTGAVAGVGVAGGLAVGELLGEASLSGAGAIAEFGAGLFAGDVPALLPAVHSPIGGDATMGMQSYQPGGPIQPFKQGSPVPGVFVTRVWSNPYTGLRGARLSDGRMVAERKDGTLKVYRPQKPIVVTRNPRLRSFVRAEERLHKLGKRIKKVVK